MRSTNRIIASSVLGTAMICLILQKTGFAQSYSIRPNCNSNARCKVNPATFGFNDTNWRQWPDQARPEEQNPDAIGGTFLPTPPPVPEQKLPHADNLPPKPPISGGTPGGAILPSLTPSTTEGSGAPGANNPPHPDRPAGPDLHFPPGDALQGIPGLDLNPRQDAAPKPEGGSAEPLTPPKDMLLPGGNSPQPLTPTPLAPPSEPAKNPGKDAPAAKPSVLLPDIAPSPDIKPEAPSPAKPAKSSSQLQHENNTAAVGANPIRNEQPMQANWNASLEPEVVGENRLQNTSFQEQAARTDNPLRSALEGYCPVQLQEHDRWVAGNPSYRLTYQGQVFVFSSDAAKRRFEAAPERFAPMLGGNDVVLAMEENRNVPGSVSHSAVWHGRVYLFSSAATLAAFHDDPSRYSKTTQQAALRLPTDSL